MKIKFGDICLVKFNPSTGDEFKKVRPALVVQSKEASKSSPYITVMPISSKIERQIQDDVFMGEDNKNRLMVDSIIKVHHISSFDKKRFIKVIGQASNPTIRKVRGYLRRHFGL